MMSFLSDAWTVLSKELRELALFRGRGVQRPLLVILIMVMLGIVLPAVAGTDWLDTGWLLTLWALAPVFLVGSVTAELVAGERERHTFETLLASRLPDRAILLGKVGAAVVYGWGLILITVLLSVATINIIYPGDSLLLYRPLLAVGGGLLSLLAAILAASVGVLISLRATSVRQAQRWTNIVFLGLTFALLLLSLALTLLPPTWGLSMGALLAAFDRVAVVASTALLLVVMNVIMLGVAADSFQRHRLHPQ
jgi:ABC-2 type transport system permease protein